MSGFEEFLEDYEEKEKENIEKFLIKLKKGGKLSEGAMYPPPERFLGLKEPIAKYNPYLGSIWGVAPFYGSTIVSLQPVKSKKQFDAIYSKTCGFTSANIEEIVDFVKETGKIQFVLGDTPTHFKYFEFLMPLLEQLNPPSEWAIPVEFFLEEQTYKKYAIEYGTLIEFGFRSLVDKDVSSHFSMDKSSAHKYYADLYAFIKTFVGEGIGDELGTLMILYPPIALHIFGLLEWLIVSPARSTLKAIRTLKVEGMGTLDEIKKTPNVKIAFSIPIPKLPIPSYDVGKFILSKIILYPETFDGCKEVIYHYEENDLYKTLEALNEGVNKGKTGIIDNQVVELSAILNNIWEDADKIRFKSEGINIGVSTSIGLIGELASELSGIGILATLGFQVADKIVGLKSDSISEKITKFISPNYLATIYDFKKTYNIRK